MHKIKIVDFMHQVCKRVFIVDAESANKIKGAVIMNNQITVAVDFIRVGQDFETAERVGASGTFQVEYVKIETPYGELDVTSLIDQGKHYYSLDQVAEDLNLSGVDIEGE